MNGGEKTIQKNAGVNFKWWLVFGSLLKQKAGVDLVSNKLVFFPLIF